MTFVLKRALLGAASGLVLASVAHAQAPGQAVAPPPATPPAEAAPGVTPASPPSTAPVAPPASAAANTVVQEVVVTAEKRSVSLTSTPAAISALSGNELKNKGVVDLQTLTSTTPSFSVSNQGPTSAVNIRGIGLSVTSPNVSAGVPLYRDSMFTGTLLPAEPLYDVADVEVLRGPQGTLVGANSTGGAVFINSISPKIGATGGYIEGHYGSYDDRGLQGAVAIPINDQLAARIAVNYDVRDSFWKDELPTDGKAENYPGALNQIQFRLGLLWAPNSQFSVLVKEDFSQNTNGGIADTPEAGTPASVGYPTQPFHLANPDGDTYDKDLQTRTTIEAKYRFNNGIQLRSVSGFQYTHEKYSNEAYTDTSATTAASTPETNHIEDHIFTQEFNILSPANDRLHWVAGTWSQFWPAHITLTPEALAPLLVYDTTTKVSNAIFGEVGYNITPKLEVHVGARYTWDRAYSHGYINLLIPPAPLQVASENDTETDSEWTGRVGVDYHVTHDHFLYGFVAKGFKTGGINQPGTPDFAPETVYDFEGGVKSTWLGGHLRTQVGAFDNDYENFQLAVNTPVAGSSPQGAVANAGSARISGGEGSFQARYGGLSVDGNAAYVHSRVSAGNLLNSYLYQSQGFAPIGLQCATGQTTNCFNYQPFYQNVNGVPNPYSPKFTGNIGVQYAIPLGEGRTLTPRLDFSYQSHQYTTVFENPVDKFEVRRLLDAHLIYNQDPWQVVFYVTNALNEYYKVGQYDFQNIYGAPFQAGARISRTF